VWFCEVEVAVGVEAQGSGVVDGAQCEVLGEFDRGGQRGGVVGAEEVGEECGEVTSVDRAGWEGVIDAPAVGVDEVSADADLGVVVFADDGDAGQACAHGQRRKVVVVGPVRWSVLYGQSVSPLAGDPAADELFVPWGAAVWPWSAVIGSWAGVTV
jgi:hypothetical protein